MPTYTYQGRDAIPEMIEPGDYIVKVVEAEAGISNGNKTRGSDTLKLKLREEESGAVIYETLIFHESCDFKIDCFIRSTGIEAKEGKSITLDPPDLIGLRGWVAVKVEEYNDRTNNRIAVWLTDRDKVAREVLKVAEEDDDDVPF